MVELVILPTAARVQQALRDPHALHGGIICKAVKLFIRDFNHSIQESKSLQVRFNYLPKEMEIDNKAKLIAISLKYSIVCPYTAFVGVESRLAGEKSREVPIEIADDNNQRKMRMNAVLSGQKKKSRKESDITVAEEDIVRRLIKMRQFNGTWTLDEKQLKQFLNVNVDKYQQILALGEDKMILSSIIALVMLEKQYKNDEQLWKPIVDKTNKCFLKHLGKKDKLDKLIEMITNVL
ncbi:unnamed protein product [Didymodactylos carnosus]|uniref:Uncharacterized protein n=1 Tax=Didymodactylos carnosus TaxID=1234261 RepID=A0A8S2CSD1_9BILA|nr:unnamed protein product [Didymodactylos carnosus]CAF3533924.1 unnamed protein product [Didymodactylos carnosus]